MQQIIQQTMEYVIKPIAYIHTDFPDKFGVPRQFGIADGLEAQIVFEEEFRRVEAVKELDGYSHIWLIWQFSKNLEEGWKSTVRPPRLGGNRRVGVFASRSPFRPNHLGLSAVKLLKVDTECPNAPVLTVAGADLVDGTPIFDIKPYIPGNDIIKGSVGGFTEGLKDKEMEVVCPEELIGLIPEEKRAGLLQVLKLDPKPSYQDDSARIYGFGFAGFEVRFKSERNRIVVTEIIENS
ncbi:MAG: tRNA (N6-threonylcarbamoyladenosine(37)-N6)-methyltransferase TrmO [Clostridia bacterium]|nr:tRNA (N6-threonylcarbamoyladenosine(37)-N6)-methyltransferase TrmO [Clostridia bacterium]